MKLSGKRFYISDTHHGHYNIIKFLREDKTKLRDFSSVEEMDNLIIENWNSVVAPNDTVVHIGDVAIARKGLSILEKLNGRKILIKGNHDIFKISDYLKYFEDVRSMEVKPKAEIIITHVPIHPSSLKENWINVHGHTHYRDIDNPNYFNISIEKMNYMPVEWNDLLRLAKEHKEKMENNFFEGKEI